MGRPSGGSRGERDVCWPDAARRSASAPGRAVTGGRGARRALGAVFVALLAGLAWSAVCALQRRRSAEPEPRAIGEPVAPAVAVESPAVAVESLVARPPRRRRAAALAAVLLAAVAAAGLGSWRVVEGSVSSSAAPARSVSNAVASVPPARVARPTVGAGVEAASLRAPGPLEADRRPASVVPRASRRLGTAR